jgi:thiaminase
MWVAASKKGIGELIGHPDADWIRTHRDPELAATTQRAQQILDRLAAHADPGTVRQIHEAFIMASRHQWMFWDAPWRREPWPV